MVCPILLLITLGVIGGQTSRPCRDNYDNYCRSTVLNRGWCDSYWAKRNCKRTCGHCRGVVQSNIMEDVSGYELGCGLSGTTENANDYVIGGKKVVGHPYPWIAKIFGGCAATDCAGTLITKRHLLTAYHCTHRPGAKKIPCDHSDGQRRAYFGTTEFKWWKKESYYSIPIIRVLYPEDAPLEPHKRWKTHDFAMAVLKKDVVWSEKVRPICLPKKGAWFYGKPTVAAGWGRFISGEHGKQSPHLRSVDLTISQTRFRHFKMFGTAVARVGRTPKDVCSGDSGGPLMYKDPTSDRWVIVGTVFGAGFNCRLGEYLPFEGSMEGIWNMVNYHVDWIKWAIRQ